MAIPSFYFTRSKKFQVLGHGPAGTNHGGGVGGFNLNNPTAIVGNRGDTGAGRYLAEGGGPKLECEAWVMVWNTGFSPAVKRPALADLDVAATAPKHEVYVLTASHRE